MRPTSTVPSEYSLVSDTSSCEGNDDKIFRLSEARPLVVPVVPDTESRGAEPGDEYRERIHKAYVIASELVTTEIRYVSILHLIDQVSPMILV